MSTNPDSTNLSKLDWCDVKYSYDWETQTITGLFPGAIHAVEIKGVFVYDQEVRVGEDG